MADADAERHFVELGLDSLTLTQVALQLKKAFGVKVTFRQLMENARSLERSRACSTRSCRRKSPRPRRQRRQPRHRPPLPRPAAAPVSRSGMPMMPRDGDFARQRDRSSRCS